MSVEVMGLSMNPYLENWCNFTVQRSRLLQQFVYEHWWNMERTCCSLRYLVIFCTGNDMLKEVWSGHSAFWPEVSKFYLRNRQMATSIMVVLLPFRHQEGCSCLKIIFRGLSSMQDIYFFSREKNRDIWAGASKLLEVAVIDYSTTYIYCISMIFHIFCINGQVIGLFVAIFCFFYPTKSIIKK